jgi:thymidylate kinase
LVFHNRLIVLLGPVGVGKSTQLNLTAQTLRQRGIKVSITQLKALHVFCGIFITLIVAFLREDSGRNPFRVLRTKRVEVAAKLFPIMALLDVPSFTIRYWLNVALPLKFGRVVLVEECMYGTLAEYVFWLKNMKTQDKISAGFMRLVERLIYKNRANTFTVYLNASYPHLTARIARRNTYTEDLKYIQMQQTTLMLLAKNLSLRGQYRYIDTTDKDVQTVKQQILPIIEEAVGL